MFVHLVPMFQKFERYFNFSDKLHIAGFDLNYDFLGEVRSKKTRLGEWQKNSYLTL